MAKKKNENVTNEVITENIDIQPLELVMGDRYSTYAKYVIQDRAIPDVRDGLKPVQRRIIYTMYRNGNTFNKPTKKCAHTVGAVMGTFHPHGDTSIYEALARMSQNWKVRYPLIQFQGNNGSIDGDMPAAYRYTESKLNEFCNELIRGIEKNTVDMQLNFDDTELEPIVLPARFPNLFANGTEGIAVGMATDIPPHNLKELIEAIIYRINHKTAKCEDLLEFVKGPDFPTGGIIYNSEGLKNIYLNGRGKVEVAAKTEIVESKDLKQIIIHEIPYKVVKKDLIFEIDKIIHAKSVSGLIEIRDESEGDDIRIAIDCKKDAKVELLLKYLMNKTPLLTSYSANMVAIVNGRPKTLNLLDYVDAYIAHQIDVLTRQTKFDLDKYSNRLHIVEGLIIASININEVVDIIKKSQDKADSKVNLIKRFNFSNDQVEAIVTMPLYKLSHTDETILENEAKQLKLDIENLTEILNDNNKLNRVLIKDLKTISDKYGDERRTLITEKVDVSQIDKRELIADERVYIALTRDGYVKRSSIKSYKSSGENTLPGLKQGDALVTFGECSTTDYLLCLTNLGNYSVIPVHKIPENRWKDEGIHLNTFVTLNVGEKIIKGIAVSAFRNDLFLAIVTKFGQIKRTPLNAFDSFRHHRPVRYMKMLNGDEVVSVELLNGNSDILILTSNGFASCFNENELSVLSAKAGGVKSISNLGKNVIVGMLTFDKDEKSKFIIFTEKGHERVLDNTKINKTSRLGKTTLCVPSFKGDVHNCVSIIKIYAKQEPIKYDLYLSDQSLQPYYLEDLKLDDINKYAKKNIELNGRLTILNVYDESLLEVNKTIKSYEVAEKETNIELDFKEENEKPEPIKEQSFEQISIFDEDDD